MEEKWHYLYGLKFLLPDKAVILTYCGLFPFYLCCFKRLHLLRLFILYVCIFCESTFGFHFALAIFFVFAYIFLLCVCVCVSAGVGA